MAYNMEDFAINYPPQGGNPQTAGNWMTSLNDWLASPQGPAMLGQIGSALVANDPNQWQTHLGQFNNQWSKSRIAAQAAAQANAQKNNMFADVIQALQGEGGPENVSFSYDPKSGNYKMNMRAAVTPDQMTGGGQAQGGGAGGGTTQPMAMPKVQQAPTLGNMLTGGENYRTYPF